MPALLHLAPPILPAYLYGFTIISSSLFFSNKDRSDICLPHNLISYVDRVSSAGCYWKEFGSNYNSFSAASKVGSSANPVLIVVRHQVLAISDFADKPLENTAKCLTAASNADAAIVTIQPCTGSASQQCTFRGGVVAVFGNKWLGVSESRLLDGTKLRIWTCSRSNANRKWGTMCVLFPRGSFFISVVDLFVNFSNT